MIKQQKIRQNVVRIVVVTLVLLPAVAMAFLTWKSLEEISSKEGFYYESVGNDLALRTIEALEDPLYAPGMRIIEKSLHETDLSSTDNIFNMLRELERLNNFATNFCWYPGPKYPLVSRRLYGNPDLLGTSLTQEVVNAINLLQDQVFNENLMYGDLPRGFYPRQYGTAVVAISKFSLMEETYIMTLLENGSGEIIGIVTYKLNEKEYLKQTRLLYNETDFARNFEGAKNDVSADLRKEVFYNLEPFNDAALEATKQTPPFREYVFRSDRRHSLCWGVRVFNAFPENSRLNIQVTHSMVAMLGALLALIVLGILIINHVITKEIELSRLKSIFVSGVSHELKTPLSLIRLFAETLLLGRIESDDEKRRFYEIINNESQRLTHMINNILDFSKIEEGRKQYDFAPHNLDELLEDTIEAYSYQLEQDGCELSVSVEDKLPLALVDPDSFKQSVINLIDNATKYSFNEKKISVKLTRSGSFIRLDVEDKGIGIDKSDLMHIFDKFFRVSNADVHQIKGSGLGLAVVRHIMDAHKGHIEVWSEPGQGSRFSLFFRIGCETNSVRGAEKYDDI